MLKIFKNIFLSLKPHGDEHQNNEIEVRTNAWTQQYPTLLETEDQSNSTA